MRDILTTKRSYFHDEIKKTHPKRVYYMCMEFLVGCQLKNNIMNLGLGEQYREALSEIGFDLDKLYELNLTRVSETAVSGRLAACFMDSLTSLDYAATGFSICYEYGFFKQRIIRRRPGRTSRRVDGRWRNMARTAYRQGVRHQARRQRQRKLGKRKVLHHLRQTMRLYALFRMT